MLSDEMLLDIRERYAHYGETEKLKPNTAVLHIRQLLAEISELKAELFEMVSREQSRD